jgi:hypothetical protein
VDNGITASELTRRAYYAVRPMLGVSVRKHLQKLHLRDWDRIAFPRWPVDVTVDTLMARALGLTLQRTGMTQIPFIWFWPDGAAGAAIMTHDVEDEAGSGFCDRLMDIDEANGIKSSFQIIPEEQYTDVAALCEAVRTRGFEVNVHDLNHDGRLFESRQRFVERAARINEYARAFRTRGFRSGAMYRQQAWFDVLDVSYDMSVPNVAHLEPQRGGCCTVMPYFIGDIVELPLTTIQDYSLFHILGDYSLDLWKQQIDLIRARHGLISFITHPDYLIEPRAQAAYVALLGHIRSLCADAGIWGALPAEVDRWWRTRRLLALVPDGASWRIEGPDAHRARVAYAVLDNGHVSFRWDHSS